MLKVQNKNKILGGNESLNMERMIKLSESYKKIIEQEKKIKNDYDVLNKEILYYDREIINEKNHITQNTLMNILSTLRTKKQLLSNYKEKLYMWLNRKSQLLKAIVIQKKIMDGKEISNNDLSFRNRILSYL